MKSPNKLVASLLMGMLTVSSVYPADSNAGEGSGVESRGYLYAHGFGEDGDSRVTFPDAPGKLFQACFYTKPAVHTLAKALKKMAVDEGKTAIDIKARSCGGGTLINCLDKFFHYDDDPNYFDGADITAEDAQAIVTAINKGSLEITVPFLSLRKVVVLNRLSTIISCIAMVGICYNLYKRRLFDSVFKTDGLKKSLGNIATTMIAGYACRPIVQGICGKMLNYIAMPAITSRNYNPLHKEPIDAVECLRGLIKCPVLLRFCKQDGVLENPDEDTVRFYAALRDGNEEKTHVILTNVGGHNSYSHELNDAEALWTHTYNISSRQHKYNPSSEEAQNAFIKQNTPTIEEFRFRVFYQIIK